MSWTSYRKSMAAPRTGRASSWSTAAAASGGFAYGAWAGLAFERFCIKHAHRIMEVLRIDQLVTHYGAYFDRHSNTKEGVQIDLLFVRHDPVITLCEMKYHQGLIGTGIISEVERKTTLLKAPKKTVEKVLITTVGISRELQDAHYFSRVLLLDELL